MEGDRQQAATVDRFQGLRRIGVDEIAYKKGHRYLTVVVDHDPGRLGWAAPGRDEDTLERFFDTYFRKGFGVGTFSKKSLRKVAGFYQDNAEALIHR